MFYERKRKRQSRGNRRSKGPVENVRRGSRSRKSSVISTRSSRSVKVDEAEPEPEPETAAETPKSMSQVLMSIFTRVLFSSFHSELVFILKFVFKIF